MQRTWIVFGKMLYGHGLALSITLFVSASREVSHASDVASGTRQFSKQAAAVVSVFAGDSKARIFNRGTGFLVSADGAVVTCRHMLDGAAGIVVHTHDGQDLFVKGVLAEARPDARE